MPRLPDYKVEIFNKGIINRIEEESIPKGAAEDSLNWLTLGDHIELRRGQQLLGNDTTGAGRITGLKVGARFDGTEIPLRSRGRKVEYYDVDADTWTEVSTTNVLPADADEEDVAIDVYHSLAGAMFYLSSPNSSIYKIPIANPGSIVDQSSTTHKGYIRIKQSRMFLWNRKDDAGGSDKNGLYGSYIDKDELSDFTFVSAEAIGASGSTNYTGTLAFKAAGAKRTCMYTSFTATVAAGTEIFRDDRNGVLTSNFGGTGTINYATGAYDITFSDTTTGSVTSDYYWEDATSAGIVDFTKSTPRTAGQGFVFRQDDGGAELQNVGSMGDAEFCMHTRKTWKLTLTADDTGATNLIYRDKVGIPYFRALAETGAGVYYVDSSDQSEAFVRLLEFNQFNTEIIPRSISDNLDLSDFDFSKAVIREWGVYILVCCQSSGGTVNDTVFAYHKIWKSWDRLDFRCSTLEEYGGALIGGDSASNNVFTLFSALTDEESEIPNFWISGKTDLDVEGQKVANRFLIAGLIDVDQSMRISLAYDDGDFVEVGTIEGDGSYVSVGQQVTIGPSTLGSKEIGGGGSGITASPYRREFRINTDKFEQVRVKFEALGVGFVSVSEYHFKDVRFKGRAISPQFVG